MATLYHTDGSVEQVRPPMNRKYFTLEQVRQLVNGKAVDVVLSDGRRIWVDQDGYTKRLPLNAQATHLYRLSFVDAGPILGPALITHEPIKSSQHFI